MARAEDSGDGSVPAPLDAAITSRQRAAVYCVLVDTLDDDGGKRSYVTDRVAASHGPVEDIYSTMAENGLVQKEGERRGAAYSVPRRAREVREQVEERYPDWEEELAPFWQAAYEEGIADSLRPVVDSVGKEEAIGAIAAGVMLDTDISATAAIPGVSNGTVNRLEDELEPRYIESEGSRRGKTYELTEEGKEKLGSVVAATGVDYTGVPFEETDWGKVPPTDPDAWVDQVTAAPSGDASASDAAQPAADQVWRATLALAYADRSGEPLDVATARYGLDVDAPGLRAELERGVLPQLLEDGAAAATYLRDAASTDINRMQRALETDDDAVGEALAGPVARAERFAARIGPLGPEDLPAGRLASLEDLDWGLERQDWAVLSYVAESGGVSKSELAAAFPDRDIDDPLQFLEADGMVALDDDHVSVTDAGRRLYTEPDIEHIPSRDGDGGAEEPGRGETVATGNGPRTSQGRESPDWVVAAEDDATDVATGPSAGSPDTDVQGEHHGDLSSGERSRGRDSAYPRDASAYVEAFDLSSVGERRRSLIESAFETVVEELDGDGGENPLQQVADTFNAVYRETPVRGDPIRTAVPRASSGVLLPVDSPRQGFNGAQMSTEAYQWAGGEVEDGSPVTDRYLVMFECSPDGAGLTGWDEIDSGDVIDIQEF